MDELIIENLTQKSSLQGQAYVGNYFIGQRLGISLNLYALYNVPVNLVSSNFFPILISLATITIE